MRKKFGGHGGDPITVELPPITEAWREISCLDWRARALWCSHAPRAKRIDNLRRALLSMRALVSIEEIFGKGLLGRFSTEALRHKGCGGPVLKDWRKVYDHEGSKIPALRCCACFNEIVGDSDLELEKNNG